MNVDWYKDFFSGIMLDMWWQALPPERTRGEADFLVRTLKLTPGARVLDVPCGHGRHAIELASRGYRLSGVDVSAGQIAEARRLSAAAGLTIDWRQADMRELPGEAQFDAAYCMGNSFGYIEPAGMRTFVAALARALRPGARFVFDTGMAAECLLTHLREREWLPLGDMLFLEENRYHEAESCLETVYTIVRDGKTHTKSGFHWVWTIREMRELLAGAGLRTMEMLKSLDGEPFRVGSPYLLLVTEKTGDDPPRA